MSSMSGKALSTKEWTMAQVGDIAKVRMGKTILSKELVETGIPVYSAGSDDEVWGFVPESDLLFGEETIVIAARGNIGLPKLPRQYPFVSTQTTIAVSLADVGLRKYLYYYFQLFDFSSLVSQTTIPMITVKQVKAIQIPIAPPEIRNNIVSEIEKQCSRLDEAVANLKRVKANLKRYKAAVLKAAVEGRLVETEAEIARREGRDYETGEQLLQRILRERRRKWEEAELAKMQAKGKPPKNDKWKQKYKEPAVPDTTNLPELPEGWVWATYSQIGEVITGFTPSTKDPENFGGNIPFFKPTDLDAGDNVANAREFLSDKGAERGRLLPAGSILVTCIGATIGKTGLARVDCATNQQINAVIPMSDTLSSRFIYFWTTSPFGYKQIVDNASATTLPILNKSKFESLAIPLPPVSEQHRIVAEVDRRLSILRETEAQVEANLQRAERLRQSILAAAFSGRLVSDDATEDAVAVG